MIYRLLSDHKGIGKGRKESGKPQKKPTA